MHVFILLIVIRSWTEEQTIKWWWIKMWAFTIYEEDAGVHKWYILWNKWHLGSAWKHSDFVIIEILTGTVMKYHVSVVPRELYFPKGLYFPEVRSTEGKYCPEGKYNYLGTTDTWYFIRPGRYLLWFPQILCALRLPRNLVTRLRVCVQNKTERKLDSLRAFYYDVLLLTTAYSAYAVHFFLGQFPNMELMLLLSPLFYLLNCYIFVIASLRLL